MAHLRPSGSRSLPKGDPAVSGRLPLLAADCSTRGPVASLRGDISGRQVLLRGEPTGRPWNLQSRGLVPGTAAANGLLSRLPYRCIDAVDPLALQVQVRGGGGGGRTLWCRNFLIGHQAQPLT